MRDCHPAKHSLTMQKPYFKSCVIAGTAAILAACSGQPGVSRSVKVSNFVIDETIKTASQSYAFADSTLGSDGYACISASVTWPDKLGDSRLRTLQDTLIARTFATVARGQSVDSAMKRFVSDTEMFGLDGARWWAVDTVPSDEAGERALYVDVTAQIVYLDEGMVTYRIASTSYMGGAHPNTVADVFTYDLANATVLGAANMFVPGSEAKVLGIVRQQLADDLHTTVDKLADSGIFTDQMDNLGFPYLSGDAVVFHYNAYDIAPYAMGDFNISVWASDLADCLSPEVKALVMGE